MRTDADGSSAQVVVVKIGSNTLVGDDGRLDLAYLDLMAGQLASVVASGRRPVLVTSGAVASGMARLGMTEKPTALSERQALAAIGQADLMHRWQVALSGHGLIGAQLLLSPGDFDDRVRYLNLTATLRALFEHGVIPVVNENDTVSVDELTLGDNDRLSALLAAQLGAGDLILLTDIDGCYTADPRRDPAALRLGELAEVDAITLAAAGDGGRLGRGGMRSKLLAARLASGAGVVTHIAHGRSETVLSRLLAGERIGTTVLAAARVTTSSRRRWLGLARARRGVLRIDAGAARALRHQGRSLLAAGITAVEGRFQRGDTVLVRDEQGGEIACGLVNLAADEIEAVKGCRHTQAIATLGYALPKAVIHRDNLLMLA